MAAGEMKVPLRRERKDKIGKMEIFKVELLKDAKDSVNPLELLKTESDIKIKEKVTAWMLALYTGTLVGAFFIFFAQGFRLFGFRLDTFILHYLGGITIGQTATVFWRLLGPIFKRK